jgi:SAM-dependent methyltransferase
MEYSFSHYLLAKQSVDDRALNRQVYEKLVTSLPDQPLRIVEVGAGIGTMLTRLLRWGLFQRAVYTLVDELPENLDYAAAWIPVWAAEHGLWVEKSAPDQLRLFDETREVEVRLVRADVFDFIQRQPAKSDLLIAHAFLDLLPMPASLEKLFSLLNPAGLAWLTINFDGVTTLEPAVDPVLDAKIEQLYHQTMDTRPTGGDSQAGRHLFGHLRAAGAEILAAGASDWVVYAENGQYPADEAYFLHFILHFFESSLTNHPELDPQLFQRWLAERRAQIERGELVYLAHQMDFLARSGTASGPKPKAV